VSATLDEWRKQIEAEGKGDLAKRLRKEFASIALRAQRQAKLLAASRLRRRTGRLINSIGGGVRTEGVDIIEAFASASTEYAASQELGATITPKRGRYLTIPLAASLTQAGVTRQSARTMPGLFVIRSKRGNLLLVRRSSNGGIEPMFALVQRTVIKPKHYLRDGMAVAASQAPPLLRAALGRAVEVKT
jgi:hypothetical protein